MPVMVDVEPSVVRRIRETSGWKAGEVAEKIGVSALDISEIEAGRKRPTIGQLRKMAAAFNYPVLALMLDKPPKQEPLPKDLREGRGRSGMFDKKTILVIRKTRRLQSIGSKMSKNLGKPVRPKIKKASLSDDPAAAAAKYRGVLGLDERAQKSGDARALFGYLRAKMEERNVLVFKFAMPVDDARGFALSDRLPAAMVVNSSDSAEGGLFTLIHEFGHILLGDTSIDLPEAGRAQHRRERWCNDFASSFLLPTPVARELFSAQENPAGTETLELLSKTYKVSKAALLFKMLDLGFVSRPECERVLARPRRAQHDRTKSPQGCPTWEQKYLSEMGKPIVSLVEDNVDAGFITYADALGCLSLKSEAFDRVMLEIRRAST